MPRTGALLLLPILVGVIAGCNGSTIHTTTSHPFVHPMAFVQRPGGERIGEKDLVWHVTLVNGGDTTMGDLSLHAAVLFNNAQLPADQVEKKIPDIAAGAIQASTFASPYHGTGDHSGPVEVWQGTQRVAHDFLFYEECPNC